MIDKYKIKFFKALKSNKRFRKNQKIFIRFHQSNYLDVYAKWRGCGRYVRSFLSLDSTVVGEIKTIDTTKEFFLKVTGWDKNKKQTRGHGIYSINTHIDLFNIKSGKN